MASWQFASDQTNPFLDELNPPPDPWGAHNVWGGGELVHYWDHAASPSTVCHILCSGSTCVFCAEESEVDFHLLRRALAPPLLS